MDTTSSQFHLDATTVRRPSRAFNPVSASFAANDNTSIQHRWTSRNNRKGRHALIVPPSQAKANNIPAYSNSPREIRRVFWRMATSYPVWDISWLIAYIYTIGCVVWMINAFMILVPIYYRTSRGLIYYAGGITACIGGIMFEIGSILLLIEAFNAHQCECFGWALEQLEDDMIRAVPFCNHHHADKHDLVRSGAVWTWWPSQKEFREHYLRDIGFIAAVAMLAASSLYLLTGILGLPGVYQQVRDYEVDGISCNLWLYLCPQLIGSLLYIVAGSLYLFESTRRPYFSSLRVLGWHIGVWSIIGAQGFLMSSGMNFWTAQTWYQVAEAEAWQTQAAIASA